MYLVDVQGTREPVRATFTDGFDGLPVFSPDGKQLMWTSNRTESGKSQLYIGRWNHQAALAALGKAKKIDVPQPDLPIEQKKLDQAKLSHEITQADIKAQVEVLASDEYEGRLTSSPGIRKAADYIVSQVKALGLKPADKEGTFLNPMSFKFGVEVEQEKNKLVIIGDDGKERTLEVGEDFSPLSFTVNNTVEAGVVFGGYGLAVAGKPGEGYDSYAGLNCLSLIHISEPTRPY